MVKMKLATLARIAPALTMLSCAAPKAIVVQEAPAVKKETAVAETTVPGPPLPLVENDGIRLPEMLDLPGEGEFRATAPVPNKLPGESGGVVSRPPTDPPSRPKPKENPGN